MRDCPLFQGGSSWRRIGSNWRSHGCTSGGGGTPRSVTKWRGSIWEVDNAENSTVPIGFDCAVPSGMR